MNRRDFVGAAAVGAVGASVSPALAQGGGPEGGRGGVLELRRYLLRFGPMEARLAEYQRAALIPALNRAGLTPVGAFSVMVGPDAPAVYLLLPHPSVDAMPTLATRLATDPAYVSASASFRALPAPDPPYLRRESTLLAPFHTLPLVQAPSGAAAAPSRVFELRTYESHNEAAGLKKIEMFETAGEIAIFRRAGLNPVFFGRNVIGTGLPSLTYMLVFEDLAAREKAWGAFARDPEWTKLSTTPGYTNADILTNIHNVLLRPTDYSQI